MYIYIYIYTHTIAVTKLDVLHLNAHVSTSLRTGMETAKWRAFSGIYRRTCGQLLCRDLSFYWPSLRSSSYISGLKFRKTRETPQKLSPWQILVGTNWL